MKFSNVLRQINKLTQSPYLAALLILALIGLLLVNQVFWGVFSGVRLWGDWFNYSIGLNEILNIKSEPDNPLYHRISLMNISFLFGAMAIALATKKFNLVFIGKQNALWAVIGGCLMGLGATLAGGCTVGGFFSPISLSAPTGFVMLIGLFIGALVGYQCFMWTLFNIKWGKPAKPPKALTSKRWQTCGYLIFLALIIWACSWYNTDDASLSHRAVLIVIGLCFGVIMQHSRFCFSSAIRSPILGGNSSMTHAILILLLLSVISNGLLMTYFKIDVSPAIPPTFWLGSLLGGFLFGFGMIFGGGCASGTLWRSAEGNIKALVTLFFMGWSGSIFTALGKNNGLLSREITADWQERTPLGEQFFLNHDLFGLILSICLTLTFVTCWYLAIKLAQKKRWYL